MEHDGHKHNTTNFAHFFHVCCRWKILTVYHVIMFLLLKLVDTWTFQERKMVTKTCASLKKNEVCDFFYNQSLEKLPKHFIHLRIICILKNMFFSYSKGWWLPMNWLSFFIGHTAFWPSCTLGRFPCPEVLIIETLIHDKLW